MEDVIGTTGTGFDDPILPDGWKEGDDLFAGLQDEDAPLSIDGFTGSSAEGSTNGNSAAVGNDSLAMGDQVSSEVPNADGANENTEPDGVEPTSAAPSRILKFMFNHSEKDFNVSTASDDELIEMAQKSMAFDAMKDEQMKAKYRQIYSDQIEAGMTEAVARMTAAHECNGKDYPLEDPAAPAEVSPVQGDALVLDNGFRAEVKQIQAVFKDFKEMPKEVMDAYLSGANLLTAYSAYRTAQSTQAAANLKKENAVLKQNAASAAKAPVTGVTSGGSVTPEPDDDFLKGFNAPLW